MRNAHARSKGLGPGFTLIELLVVIAIVALLIAILLPALGRGLAVCRQARELAAAQQMMIAYTMYADDNSGRVMPGYLSNQMASKLPDLYDDQGRVISGEAAKRYPWRLVSYLDGNFRGLYQNDQVFADLRGRDDYQYVMSVYPSLGVNGFFVGGRAGEGFAFDPNWERYYGRFYVRRLDEVRRPTRLIAFASARGSDSLGALAQPVGEIEGYFEVRPPRFDEVSGRRWDESYDRLARSPGSNSGFVSLRSLGRSVTASLDAHAESLSWDQLTDMTRWANQATGPDWALEIRGR